MELFEGFEVDELQLSKCAFGKPVGVQATQARHAKSENTSPSKSGHLGLSTLMRTWRARSDCLQKIWHDIYILYINIQYWRTIEQVPELAVWSIFTPWVQFIVWEEEEEAVEVEDDDEDDEWGVLLCLAFCSDWFDHCWWYLSVSWIALLRSIHRIWHP